MSLVTWKQEFYPVKPTKKMSTIEAINHSLQKWEGLKAKNLKKHEVNTVWSNRELEDGYRGNRFDISINTCALCVKFYDRESEDEDGGPCIKCPLYEARGRYACDKDTPKEDELSDKLDRFNAHPFSLWIDDKNPLPMIRDLKKTLKMLERGELENK